MDEPRWMQLQRRATARMGSDGGEAWIYRWLESSPETRAEMERGLQRLEDGTFER